MADPMTRQPAHPLGAEIEKLGATALRIAEDRSDMLPVLREAASHLYTKQDMDRVRGMAIAALESIEARKQVR